MAQMKAVEGKLMMMPPKEGHCRICFTEHEPNAPHNWWSLSYQVRFKLRYKRDATHADAIAHLTERQQQKYIEVLKEHGVEYTEPDAGFPIAEPIDG